VKVIDRRTTVVSRENYDDLCESEKMEEGNRKE
jgi:hypothetical protein